MNKPELKLIGGTDTEEEPRTAKDGLIGDDPFWLNNVPQGTIFFVKKGRDSNLGVFALRQRTNTKKNSTELIKLPEGVSLWQDPKDFSLLYTLFEVYLSPEDIKSMEKEDGSEDNPDNPE